MTHSRQFRSIFLILFLLVGALPGEDKPLYMGIIIKDNEALIQAFLRNIESLEYDKRVMILRMDIVNDNPEIKRQVNKWCKRNREKYAHIVCQVAKSRPSTIKNLYLDHLYKTDLIFIISSDIFLKPFTLRWLANKNLPVAAPMLRPLPKANDPFRNFYLSATENGYYKEHPEYYEVADRKKKGTFLADCVHGAYLIHADDASKLNFDDGSAWDFISFSNSARKNLIPQYICNEREFGFFIHSDEPTNNLSSACLTRVVTRDKVQEISSKFTALDPNLQTYQENFPIENYSLYPVKEDLYWVDEKWDWVKSNYIKKGLVWEPHIEKLFHQHVKEGDTVLDIGGHIGTHTMVLSRCVGPRGKVHVFEPQVKLFTELLVNTYLNGCENVEPHRVALGAKGGVAYMDHPCLKNEGMARISSKGEKVPVKTLDSFQLSNISLIKMDIEGYEMEALKGALSTLQKNRPVMIVEVFQGAECSERLKFIEGLGYEITHLEDNDYLCVPAI